MLARPPTGIIERTVMWTRRHPAAAIFIVAILVLAVTSAGAGVWFKQQQDDLQEAKYSTAERAQDAVKTALNRAGELREQERRLMRCSSRRKPRRASPTPNCRR